MKTDRLARLGPFQIAAGAMAFSLLCALAVLAATRLLARAVSPQPAEQAPSVVQPVLDTPISTDPPAHFTEEIIVPGFTETGAQISEEDATHGRSPEGV